MENSIEEDIELLQDETSSLGLFFKCKGSEEYKIALEHILSDYKRVLKENEILKNKLLDTLKGQKAIEEETPQYVKENYISKENKRQLMRSALRKDRYYNKFIRE